MYKEEKPLIDLEVQGDGVSDDTMLTITVRPLWSKEYGWPDQIGEGQDTIKIPDFFKKKRYRGIPLIHVIYWHEFKKTKFPFKYLRAFEEYSMDERLQILQNNQQNLNSESWNNISEMRAMGALYILHAQTALRAFEEKR